MQNESYQNCAVENAIKLQCNATTDASNTMNYNLLFSNISKYDYCNRKIDNLKVVLRRKA